MTTANQRNNRVNKSAADRVACNNGHRVHVRFWFSEWYIINRSSRCGGVVNVPSTGTVEKQFQISCFVPRSTEHRLFSGYLISLDRDFARHLATLQTSNCSALTWLSLSAGAVDIRMHKHSILFIAVRHCWTIS